MKIFKKNLKFEEDSLIDIEILQQNFSHLDPEFFNSLKKSPSKPIVKIFFVIKS
jgi:hypothetical protein